MPQSDFWPFVRSKALDDVDISGETSLLQKQLGDMEGDVKEIQMELAAIKRNRMDLYHQQRPKIFKTETDATVRDIELNETVNKSPEEKYNKILEVSKLREDLIKAKNAVDEEKFQREKYERKLKDLEQKLNNICHKGVGSDVNETRKFSDEEFASLKNQMRDTKEELEEMKITVAEKSEQLQEYRMKAQQQVEELKRQLDVIEFDNKQVSDQIQLEIQKMKMQFQEKLQELAPLPDLLKGAQIQLQEARQLQRLAEDSSLQLSNELHRVKEKLVAAVNSLNQEKADKTMLSEENKFIKVTVNEKQKEIDDLSASVDDYKCKLLRLEEKLSQQENKYKEKTVECTQLLKDLDELRMESNRSLSRCKDRSDSMRRYLQTQISELERQLIQSRAQCRACQKERDEIRQRMQIQINSLQENFELVEIRLRGLQNQVTSLKNSYTVILTDDEDNSEFNKIAT